MMSDAAIRFTHVQKVFDAIFTEGYKKPWEWDADIEKHRIFVTFVVAIDMEVVKALQEAFLPKKIHIRPFRHYEGRFVIDLQGVTWPWER